MCVRRCTYVRTYVDMSVLFLAPRTTCKRKTDRLAANSVITTSYLFFVHFNYLMVYAYVQCMPYLCLMGPSPGLSLRRNADLYKKTHAVTLQLYLSSRGMNAHVLRTCPDLVTGMECGTAIDE